MIYEQLSESEAYLFALFQDESGIDQAEFCFIDETSPNGLFRAWPIQKYWWADPAPLSVSQGSRSVGKSLSLKFRAFAFPFILPGEEMVVTAPEGGHLDAVMDNIETLFTNNRIAEGMLAADARGRIKHRPWMINFASGARILGKIPKHDGSGVRGIHPIWLEQDEASFFPEAGWTEIIETVKVQHPKARWRAHGVTIGPGNTFDDIISGTKDEQWKVNRLPAMFRPNWSDKERKLKITQYGSEDNVDYRRNVLGLSGNAGISLVVLHRLMSCVDTDLESDYNQDYFNCKFDDAQIREVSDVIDLVDPPISHMQYKKIWMGMDFGLTTSASCIVIFAEVKEKEDSHSKLKMIGKVTMVRTSTEDQVKVIMHLMEMYRPVSFTFDAHGFGQPAFEWLQKEVRENEEMAWMLERVKGYSFSKKMIVGFDDNIEIHEADPEGWMEAVIEKLGSEASLDALRYVVDTKRVQFPFDKPMLAEIQAIPRQEKPLLDEYGKSKRKSGQHTLDALRFVFLSYTQREIDDIIASYEAVTWQAPDMIILDYI